MLRTQIISTSVLVVSGLFLSAAPNGAVSETVKAVRCTDCDSMADLQAAAQQHWEFGAIVLVSSEAWPISAYFKMGYDQILLPPWYTPVDIQWAFFLTVDEQSAQKLDNELYARAAKLQIVDVPAEIAPSGTGVTPEIVESWLTSQSGPFAIVPGTGTDIWHAITNWGSSAVWFNVLEKGTGEVKRVFLGDTVVIKFEDGVTWEVEFLGPFAPAGQIFIKVPNSERDANGDPITGSVGGPPSTSGGSASLLFANLFDLESQPTLDCAIVANITTCEDVYGQSQCTTAVRALSVPCDW